MQSYNMARALCRSYKVANATQIQRAIPAVGYAYAFFKGFP
ncbi:hypothetical protein [Nostoc sp.]